MALSATPGLWEEFSNLHREFLQGVYSGDKPSICGLDSHQPEFRPPNDPSNKEQYYSVLGTSDEECCPIQHKRHDRLEAGHGAQGRF